MSGDAPLVSLTIRDLDDEIYERLRIQAVRHGVSVEEEAHQILTKAVSPPERMGELFLKIFGPENGVDLELQPREPHDPS